MVVFGRVFALIFCACAIGITIGCEESTPGSSLATGTVQLEIEFNSERKNINVAVPCSVDSTVFTILQRAHNMGDLKFDSMGLTDDMKFVTSIGGVDNLNEQGDNWVFRVNGKLGDKSAGVYPVKPGDQIQWAFGKYDENED